MNRIEKNRLHSLIFESALEVHKILGTGLVPTVYRMCFLQELRNRAVFFRKDCSFPVYYKDIKLDAEITIELLVENEIIVEIKATDKITAHHEAHLLSALKMCKKNSGIIFNFNEPKLVEGFKKINNI